MDGSVQPSGGNKALWECSVSVKATKWNSFQAWKNARNQVRTGGKLYNHLSIANKPVPRTGGKQ